MEIIDPRRVSSELASATDAYASATTASSTSAVATTNVMILWLKIFEAAVALTLKMYVPELVFEAKRILFPYKVAPSGRPSIW